YLQQVQNQPDSSFVVIALPPIEVHFRSDPSLYPDGWTECMIPIGLLRRLLNTPGYPQPLQQLPEIRHRVGPSPLGGTGLFATVNLKPGDLVLNERAMMIKSRAYYRSAIEGNMSMEEYKKSTFEGAEREIKTIFGRMTKEKQEAFMTLWNSHEHDGSGPLIGRLRTNAFGVELEDGGIAYAGLFDIASRVNHSCCPNLGRTFNKTTFAMELRTARHVKKGEELLTCYVGDPDGLTHARRQELASYQFDCRCPSCKRPEITDQLRMSISKEKPQRYGRQRLVVWLMNQHLPESYVVDHSLSQLRLMEKEGLEMASWYGDHLEFLAEVYCAMGNSEKALAYWRNFYTFLLVVHGEDVKFKDNFKASEKWRKRWSWRSRVSVMV
ncbi:hypothetical protein V5O48_013348, partial [Marasmius crinis-equi]